MIRLLTYGFIAVLLSACSSIKKVEVYGINSKKSKGRIILTENGRYFLQVRSGCCNRQFDFTERSIGFVNKDSLGNLAFKTAYSRDYENLTVFEFDSKKEDSVINDDHTPFILFERLTQNSKSKIVVNEDTLFVAGNIVRGVKNKVDSISFFDNESGCKFKYFPKIGDSNEFFIFYDYPLNEIDINHVVHNYYLTSETFRGVLTNSKLELDSIFYTPDYNDTLTFKRLAKKRINPKILTKEEKLFLLGETDRLILDKNSILSSFNR